MGEASCGVVEDALSARFIGEDEVSDSICDLDATTGRVCGCKRHGSVKVLTSYTPFISRNLGPC